MRLRATGDLRSLQRRGRETRAERRVDTTNFYFVSLGQEKGGGSKCYEIRIHNTRLPAPYSFAFSLFADVATRNRSFQFFQASICNLRIPNIKVIELLEIYQIL